MHSSLWQDRADYSEPSFLDTNPLLSLHHLSGQRRSTVIPSAPHAQLGRSFPLVCGVGLGGTSRINGNQYTCGVPAQYNAWSDQGRKGWSYAELKPYFLKSERWTGPVPQEYHVLNGGRRLAVNQYYTLNSCYARAPGSALLGALPVRVLKKARRCIRLQSCDTS